MMTNQNAIMFVNVINESHYKMLQKNADVACDLVGGRPV